ncbi:MAG TPA: tetratricopeptide repeat protein [Polyangia bacterium]|jgi:tetratricopeptide (TPR) repeat protein
MKGSLRARQIAAATAACLLFAPAAGRAVPDGSFWGKVAGAAPAAHAGDDDDIAALLERVDADETAGRLDAACARLEKALPRYTGAERNAAWFRLGIVRSRLGRYRESASAYAAMVADGAADSAVYSNFAEVLMAAGRLHDAEARYRDAISAASDLAVGERRERTHELALAYYGLAVALDRDEQPAAAREAMMRALAHDPTASVLKVAATSGGDLFFVPEGDVFYYLGLAAEVEGRDGDAESAFQEFIARAPHGRWVRAANAHLARKPGPGQRRVAGTGGVVPRVLAHATVLAAGSMAAPLVDAAWRDQLGILDDCLDGVRLPSHTTVRFAIEMDVDRRGRPTRVIVKAPAPFDERFARCVESATTQRLRLSLLGPASLTLARTEMVVGTP